LFKTAFVAIPLCALELCGVHVTPISYSVGYLVGVRLYAAFSTTRAARARRFEIS
jgi:hypothetical protein